MKLNNNTKGMTKKSLIIICITVISAFFLWIGFLWKIFSCGVAGSYPCVETWNLKVKERDLIKVIQDVKKEHPEFEPPNISFPTSGKHEYWYDFTFYYKDTKENVYTWIRQNSDTSYTTIALVAIATHVDSLTPIHEIKMVRKEINRDYGYFANKKEISKFENKILNLIREKIKQP